MLPENFSEIAEASSASPETQTPSSSPAAFESLELRRAAEVVYDILREKILSCELRPGRRLDVGEISRQLGISRTPVKDALQRLSAQDLIKIHSRKGTFVTEVTPVDVKETFQVRAALEGKACELVSGRLNESQLGTLRDLNGKMWAPELSIVEHAELNNEFHRLIVQFSENRRLLSTYEELNAHLQIARVRYRSNDWRDQRTNIVREHQDVVDAIAEDRGSDAKRLMELHIEASMTRLIEGISESSG